MRVLTTAEGRSVNGARRLGPFHHICGDSCLIYDAFRDNRGYIESRLRTDSPMFCQLQNKKLILIPFPVFTAVVTALLIDIRIKGGLVGNKHVEERG